MWQNGSGTRMNEFMLRNFKAMNGEGLWEERSQTSINPQLLFQTSAWFCKGKQEESRRLRLPDTHKHECRSSCR